MTLLDALQHLQLNGAVYETSGICWNTHQVFEQEDTCLRFDEEKLKQVFVKWPKFSGDIEYPVPSSTDGCTPREQYDFTDNVWEGDYGDLRKELLQFCIDELSKEQVCTN